MRLLLFCLLSSAFLTACGPSLPTPPSTPPTVDAARAWGKRLAEVVSPEGRVDYAALRADPTALRNYVGWAAVHGPETDRWRHGDNSRLAYALNVMNAFTLWAVVESAERRVDRRPFTVLRFEIDNEVVRYDRYLSHRVLALYDEPLAIAALGCASLSCPPVSPRLYQKSGLDSALADQMTRWITTGRLLRADGDTLIFSPALGPWVETFEQLVGARTPCDIVAPYVPAPLLPGLKPLLEGECRYAWGAWDGELDGS